MSMSPTTGYPTITLKPTSHVNTKFITTSYKSCSCSPINKTKKHKDCQAIRVWRGTNKLTMSFFWNETTLIGPKPVILLTHDND